MFSIDSDIKSIYTTRIRLIDQGLNLDNTKSSNYARNRTEQSSFAIESFHVQHETAPIYINCIASKTQTA